MKFAEKLRKVRQARELSQSQLAKEIGVTTRTLQYYESGERFPKNRDIIDKLVKVLNVDEDSLMDEETAFVLNASQTYGPRGVDQALGMVNGIRALAAGGQLDEDELDIVMKSMQEAYWDAKEYNRRYVNKRYRKDAKHTTNGDTNGADSDGETDE